MWDYGRHRSCHPDRVIIVPLCLIIGEAIRFLLEDRYHDHQSGGTVSQVDEDRFVELAGTRALNRFLSLNFQVQHR